MKLKTFIAEFFRDDSGMSSATRLAFLVWSLGVFCIWIYICILDRTLVPIPQTVVELTLVFIGGKMGGAWVEGMGVPNLPPPPAPQPPPCIPQPTPQPLPPQDPPQPLRIDLSIPNQNNNGQPMANVFK